MKLYHTDSQAEAPGETDTWHLGNSSPIAERLQMYLFVLGNAIGETFYAENMKNHYVQTNHFSSDKRLLQCRRCILLSSPRVWMLPFTFSACTEHPRPSLGRGWCLQLSASSCQGQPTSSRPTLPATWTHRDAGQKYNP